MAKMTGNHSSYYIERAVRKQKKEYILSLIKASYYAEKNASETRPLKTILIERLTYALALFRDDVIGYSNGIGGYSAEQFDKDYTVGHEMAIWKNSNLELNDYAKLVAEDKITVTDYFDRIFINYFQPVNNLGVHPLYNILNFLKINNKKEIGKEEASQALGVPIEGQDVNGLFHYLGDTSYFDETREGLLYVSALSIEELIKKCNIRYIGENYTKLALNELNQPNSYNNYISSEIDILDEQEEEIDDIKFKFRKWLISLDKYKPQTIKNYVYYVGYVTKKGYSNIDFYLNPEIKEIELLIDKLKNDEEYKQFNKKNDYNPSSALIAYRDYLLTNNIEENTDTIDNTKVLVKLSYDNRVIGGTNEIYYGVPGCGKSQKVKKICNEKGLVYKRTTFYPDYTNGEFVGQVVPQIDDNNNIEYVIQPGYFTKVLYEAMLNPDKKYCLVIEEINRGNASAIFGDIFQLLDRENSTGTSEYNIENDIISKYFTINGYELSEIRIPSNLWIMATMNTSDQNVYTLDTAFKRRWNLKKITNLFDASEPYDNKIKDMLIPGSDIVTWKMFVDKINNQIRDNNSYGINAEDKQIGKYFVGVNELVNQNVEEYDNLETAKRAFAEKVLMYLWEDVTKLNHEIWFNPKYKTLDELLIGFDEENLKIFNNLFIVTEEAEDINE